MSTEGPGKQTAAAPTLLERMVSAGIEEDRALRWLESEAVHVEGEIVKDGARPTPYGERWAINPR